MTGSGAGRSYEALNIGSRKNKAKAKGRKPYKPAAGFLLSFYINIFCIFCEAISASCSLFTSISGETSIPSSYILLTETS